MNEYYDLVERVGGDWNDIVEGFVNKKQTEKKLNTLIIQKLNYYSNIIYH